MRQTPWYRCPSPQHQLAKALALRWEAGKLQRELARLPGEKLSAKEEADQTQRPLKVIAETRNMARSKAKVAPIAFQIHDGEMMAAANTPGKSVYELTAKVDAPALTALRIEVLPLNGETAVHTPEGGFIVDQIEAWVIQPNGRQDKIVFDSFVSDSEADLKPPSARAVKSQGSKLPEELAPLGQILNCSRVAGRSASRKSPSTCPAGSRLKVQLIQTENASDKPALVRRARLAVSGDSRWSALGHDPTLAVASPSSST